MFATKQEYRFEREKNFTAEELLWDGISNWLEEFEPIDNINGSIEE